LEEQLPLRIEDYGDGDDDSNNNNNNNNINPILLIFFLPNLRMRRAIPPTFTLHNLL
jgi:hypothetical protein